MCLLKVFVVLWFSFSILVAVLLFPLLCSPHCFLVIQVPGVVYMAMAPQEPAVWQEASSEEEAVG